MALAREACVSRHPCVMLPILMKRFIPALLLVAAVVPFATTGCDMLKKGGADAGADGAVALAAADAAVNPATTDTAPPTATTTAAPLNTTTPIPPVRVVTTDAGAKTADAAAPVDAGAAKADGGAAPMPTPTLTIPPIPGFDAGGLRFDAGGFKPPWQK